uniref:Uncharacterized protein n=1 Tax=Rhizophora mucronata TaxID=61149 RepID=A0A2P2NR32_RHIMU
MLMDTKCTTTNTGFKPRQLRANTKITNKNTKSCTHISCSAKQEMQSNPLLNVTSKKNKSRP